MASIRRKQNSKFWFACFNLPDGRRVQRSTKQTNRREAQKLADEFESAANGRITARQAQRVISDIYRRVTGEALPSSTVRDYFDSWLDQKKAETSMTTFSFYKGKARH